MKITKIDLYCEYVTKDENNASRRECNSTLSKYKLHLEYKPQTKLHSDVRFQFHMFCSQRLSELQTFAVTYIHAGLLVIPSELQWSST